MPQPPNWSPDLSQPEPGSDAALALGWSWPAARQACDDDKRGTFGPAWQLWTDMDSLASIRAAKNRRMASPCGLPWEVVGPERAPGRLETAAARTLWERHVRRLLKSTLSDLIGLGFSVWQHPTAVNPITLRREVITVQRWPLSQVRYAQQPFPDAWQPGKWIEGYYAIQFGIGETIGAMMLGPQTLKQAGLDASARVPAAAYLAGGNGVWWRFIQLPRPGETDGHWTVVADPIGADQPHLSGAVTALDVSYVGGAIMTRAMYALAKTLGRQGIYGEMPPETPPQGGPVAGQPTDGMSPEGRAMRRTVAGFGTAEADAVIPNGAKLAAVSLASQTAGLFPEFAAIALRDVELAILGHAGSTAKQDKQYAPKDGVETKVPQHLERADVRTICAAFEGIVNLLAAENGGDTAPIKLLGHLPNAEDDERRAAEQEHDIGEAKKYQEAWKAFAAERDNGFDFPPTPEGQARLNLLFAKWGCKAPTIPPEGLPPVLVKVPKPTVPIEGEEGAALPAPAPAGQPLGAPPPPA